MAVSNIKPNLNIHIKPNQTLKDFSYGQKFVKGLASRSIAPVILLEALLKPEELIRPTKEEVLQKQENV